ncbi:hypothetical protein AWB77_03685 [Caballeronia fortuita]|uniref:Phasin family protein n=1 Tax=Caballeronia fortuita TaxID=1777138 RepID=A0A158C657_9BURK|nr:hypothetical protein [Caballeronia fortuita]SAK77761.1 hypothetical protein AWB77_03685 [Caballeronia fortuita]
MYPVLMQPFFSVAQASLETSMRAASSVALGFQHVRELNEKTIQSTLANVRMQSGALDAAEARPAMPLAFFSYANELFSIITATTADVIGAMGANASLPEPGTPKLVLADAVEPSPTGGTAIVDATGEIVARVPK